MKCFFCGKSSKNVACAACVQLAEKDGVKITFLKKAVRPRRQKTQ